MVTMGQLVGMILAVTVPILLAIVLFIHIRKELKVKGLGFTACYGALGYLWEAWIYVMAYGWVGGLIMQYSWFESGFGEIVKQVIIAVLYALLVTGALCWALYLANMRELRMERGPAVGVGFGFSYIIWNFVLVYGAPLVYGFQMRFGAFGGSEEAKEKVLSLPVENMYLFILDTIIYLLIVTGTTLLMAESQRQEKRLRMFLIPLVSQFAIKFLDTFLPTLMPDLASTIVYHIITGAAALWSLKLLFDFLKTREVVITRSSKSTQ